MIEHMGADAGMEMQDQTDMIAGEMGKHRTSHQDGSSLKRIMNSTMYRRERCHCASSSYIRASNHSIHNVLCVDCSFSEVGTGD